MGAVWLQKDTPMLLHIFAYVTREVLKAWWSVLKPQSDHETCDVGIFRDGGEENKPPAPASETGTVAQHF
jgi:hypothetical protein